MSAPRIVAFVMAGGEGARLRPMTAECPKPALPFGQGYRIIDFVLSNLYHSNVRSIYVLAQYRAKILMDYIAQSWLLPPAPTPDFVQPVVPTGNNGESAFRGTADAVWKNLDLLDRLRPDIVAVFAADHVYRMDVRQMIAFHNNSDADVTVAAVPVPIADATSFGVIASGVDGRIRAFQEKPRNPAALPHDPRHAYASMGNYLFRTDVLRHALAEAAARGEYDFGLHVLPRLVNTHRVYAYDFSNNRIPNLQRHEELGYWRDVGTLQAYADAQSDLVGPSPRFRLDNEAWKICPFGDARGLAAAANAPAEPTEHVSAPASAGSSLRKRYERRIAGPIAQWQNSTRRFGAQP